jgi:hypothetical protein
MNSNGEFSPISPPFEGDSAKKATKANAENIRWYREIWVFRIPQILVAAAKMKVN